MAGSSIGQLPSGGLPQDNYLIPVEHGSTTNYYISASGFAYRTHSHGNPTLNLTNLSGTTASASNGLTLSLAAPDPAAKAGTGFTSAAAGSIGISGTHDTAGLSLSLSIPAFLTTARASNDAVGLNTALTAGPLAWTVNSSGISLNAGSAAGTTSGFAGNSISGSITHNTAGLNLSLNHPAWLTTAAQSNHSHGNPQLNLTNLSGTTASNSAGLTLSLFGAVGAGVTTAGANIGLSGTLSTNGLSLSATVPATSSLSATGQVSISVNGSTISIGVPSQTNQTLGLYAVSNTTGQSSSSTFDARTLSFHGAGIASVGYSGGSVVISVPSGGGAGDGVNILAAGTQTANTTGSVLFQDSNGVTFGMNNSSRITATVATNYAASNHSHGNPTLNLTNLSGTTASASNGFTLSLSAAAAAGASTASGYAPYADHGYIVGAIGQATLNIDPELFPNFQFDRVLFQINNTNSSNSSGSHTLSFWLGLYTKNASTLSLASSTSTSIALTHSGTAGSYSLYSGLRHFSVPWTATVTQGEYWVGFVSRTTSGGANGSYSNLLISNPATNFVGFFSSAHNTTMQMTLGQGVYSATTSGIPNSIAFSQIRGSDSAARRPPNLFFASGTI